MNVGRRRLPPFGAALVAFVLAAMVGPVMLVARQGSASFAASDTIGVNQVAAATVEVEAGEAGTKIVVDAMAPGDSAVGTVEVVNRGSMRVRYAMTSSADGSQLADWLRWDIWQRTGPDCGLEPPPSAVLADAVLRDGTAVFGNPATGPDPGDRALEPQESAIFCLRVRLPLETPDPLQGRSLDQEFTVVAEQFPEDNT